MSEATAKAMREIRFMEGQVSKMSAKLGTSLAENAALTRALAESRGRMRAVLVDKAKMLKQEDCDCGAEGGTLESGTAEVVCHGHEILEAMSKALTTPATPQGGA